MHREEAPCSVSLGCSRPAPTRNRGGPLAADYGDGRWPSIHVFTPIAGARPAGRPPNRHVEERMR
jgi:hypothetical protein